MVAGAGPPLGRFHRRDAVVVRAPADPLVPVVFLVLVTGFLGLRVKAARLHTSVELTPEYLRQGTESIRVSDMVGMFPERAAPMCPVGSRTGPSGS